MASSGRTDVTGAGYILVFLTLSGSFLLMLVVMLVHFRLDWRPWLVAPLSALAAITPFLVWYLILAL